MNPSAVLYATESTTKVRSRIRSKAVRGEGDAIRLETPRMRTRVRTTRTHTPASEAEKKKRCMQAHTRARARKRERERESSNAISFEPSPASKVRHARKYACGAFRLTLRAYRSTTAATVRYARACSQVAHGIGRSDSSARIRNQGILY